MEQNVIVGLLSFFLGLILGHRLSLGRDKRKEFNNLTKDIYAGLYAQIRDRTGTFINIDNIPRIEPYICIIYRKRFSKMVAAYENCKHDISDYNQREFGTVPINEQLINKLIQHAKDLIPYFYPR